ncbi:MAG TPA: CBS domain-containing protein [Streptosporangiaceae bacterium]|nr:CBS domain-containing protein [Streptosporangiaceae bacterium]
MSRREEYLESMLRNLGSVYYQTLQGQATEAEVAEVVEAVRAHRDQGAIGMPPRRQGKGKWRVADVMSADVITVDKNLPYKEVARLLAETGLTAVPVLSGGRRVLGMVSEADVLRKEERSFGRLSAGLPRRTRHERDQAEALTAAEMMTAPAVTIHPDAPLGAAARLMNGRHIRRLPVVGPAGEIIGMVSRRDLLSVFLRPDSEIAEEVAEALSEVIEPAAGVTVSVAEGVVTLSGELPKADLIGTAVRVAGAVEGVVTVANGLVPRQAVSG